MSLGAASNSASYVPLVEEGSSVLVLTIQSKVPGMVCGIVLQGGRIVRSTK